MGPEVDIPTPYLPPSMGAVGITITSGPGDVPANRELIVPSVRHLVAAQKPAVVDVSMGRIPELSPKASWVLTVVSDVESGSYKPAPPECTLLPSGWLGLQPVPGLPHFPTVKSVQAAGHCWPQMWAKRWFLGPREGWKLGSLCQLTF